MSTKEEDTKAADEKTSKSKLTCMLVWTALAASIGSGFQHGYNNGVVNSPTDIIKAWIGRETSLDKDQITLFWSFIVSIYCIGGMVGGGLTSVISNSLGRRNGLIYNNILAVIAGIVMCVSKYANSPYVLIVGRIISGVNCGINAGISPMYLTEISPMRIRGAIGSLYQLLVTISILVAQLLGVSSVLGTDDYWGILFALIIIPAVYQFLALFLSPESPKFLLKKGENEKAMKACNSLAGKTQAPIEYEFYKSEIEEAAKLPKVTFKDMFRVPKYRKPLVIMTVLMLAQQFSGINAVIFYSTQIFKIGSIGGNTAEWLTVGVGLTNVVMTIISVFLVEITGRKPLLFVGFFGMAVVTIVLYICLCFAEESTVALYIAIVCVYVFIVLFAAGAGSIPWIIGSELFATAARPLGLSMAVPVNWFGNFVITLIFLPLKEVMGPSVFVIFIVCQILSGVYIVFFIPETKNRPIEEITAKF